MSVIELALAKSYLDVIHDADDDKLQMLLDAAEDEAARLMNRGLLDEVVRVVTVCGGQRLVAVPPVSAGQAAPPASMVLGVMLLLQAAYQSSPDDAEKLRRAAEVKLAPYRIGWGA